jgi:segregation and condensation protein B
MPLVPESDQALDWVTGNLPAEETNSPQPEGPADSPAAETPAAETPSSPPPTGEAAPSTDPEPAPLPEAESAELAASLAVPASADLAPESLPVPEAVTEPAPEPLPAPEVVEEPPLGPLPPTEPLSLESLVESLLFVAEGPVPVARLSEALEVSPREVEAALDQLAETYKHRGLSVQRLRDKVQLTTTPAAAEKVQRFLGLAAATPLSRAALETLAIIAYQQPVTRPQIEAVRGVNSDGVIKNLLSKGIIDEVGRTDGPGRPVLYTTTPEFLQYFGLASLADLPSLNLDQRPAAGAAASPESLLKE